MSEDLNTAVLAVVIDSGLGDYDQRSAIGMARSFLENGKPVRYNPDQVEYPERDALAKRLVELIEDEDVEDAVGALREARAKVNEPFIDAGMAGFRARAGDLNKPGKNKKGDGEMRSINGK